MTLHDLLLSPFAYAFMRRALLSAALLIELNDFCFTVTPSALTTDSSPNPSIITLAT